MYEEETRISFHRIRGGSRISKVYQKKAVLYGNKIEIYEYEKPQISFSDTRISHTKRANGKRSKSSVNRARSMLFRLVEGNIFQHGKYQPVFCTLTYKDNISDLKACNDNFKNFIKRLNYNLETNLKYLCVPEWQKRGAVHYHIVFFNLPYIDKFELEKIWGYGMTNIQVIKNIRSMGAYLAKYFSKSCHDSRLYGQKAYMASRDLKRPIDVYGGFEVDKIVSDATIEKKEVNLYTSYKHIKLSCKQKLKEK